MIAGYTMMFLLVARVQQDGIVLRIELGGLIAIISPPLLGDIISAMIL